MDDFVRNKLSEWGLSDFMETFKDQGINKDHFYNLEDEEIKELIPKVGPRKTFKQYLKLLKVLPSTSEIKDTRNMDMDPREESSQCQSPSVKRKWYNSDAGMKWTPKVATQQAKAALQHADVVDHVKQGRSGLGLGQSWPFGNKVPPSECRKLVGLEVRQEEATRCAQAVTQAKQGHWEMETGRSFLLSLPNLSHWLNEDPSCSLCSTRATLKHILTSCRGSLTQGRYTWRHNHVLKCLAAIIETKVTTTNALPSKTQSPVPKTPFVRSGEQGQRGPPPLTRSGQLEHARDWEMLVDLDKQLKVPSHIVTTTQRPDLVLWSNTILIVYLIELTVPWEDAVGKANERKRLRYAEMASMAEQRGWKAIVRPVEVGCRGLNATSTITLLKDLGIQEQALHQTINETAERCSQCLWTSRNDLNWAPSF